MLELIEKAPPDPIFGLTDKFKKDPNPEKVNLGVGTFQDAQGKVPILECVNRAETLLLKEQDSKNYLGIEGSPDFARCVQRLLYGEQHEFIQSQRIVTAQTPGGTGSLRVAGEFIKKFCPDSKIWLSDPTWSNHQSVFQAAGFEIVTYPYYDYDNKCLLFDQLIEALSSVPKGDVVLFHACCHNPTGMDPMPEQWQTIAKLTKEKGFLPLLDFAYQGFARGLDEDAASIRAFAWEGCEIFVSSSYSKNFGLYNERIGALSMVCADPVAAENALSHIKVTIRANFSNPPAHGSLIVTTILGDPQLTELWLQELASMRDRINDMRSLFVKTLKALNVKEDFSFITQQHGLFSFTGLSKEQVKILKDKHSIYIVGSGRINISGLTTDNMGRICEAIAEVLSD